MCLELDTLHQLMVVVNYLPAASVVLHFDAKVLRTHRPVNHFLNIVLGEGLSVDPELEPGVFRESLEGRSLVL